METLGPGDVAVARSAAEPIAARQRMERGWLVICAGSSQASPSISARRSSSGAWVLFYRDIDGFRCDAVRHDDERTRAGVHLRRNVEVSRDWERARGDAHRAVTVRARVKDVPRRVIGDAHQRIVRRILVFVAV